jgi:hypothetical protein
MARKSKTMSAPAQAKRITSTGLAKVSLPDMPTMSTSTDFTPGKMAGMGGTGMGLGTLGGMGGGGGGGGGIPFFGLRGSGVGMIGEFYDGKRTQGGRPTPLAALNTTNNWEVAKKHYGSFISQFCSNGFRLNGDCYQSPTKLSIVSFYFHEMPDTEAGKAFQDPETKPGLWLAHYRGSVTPPESGKYRFVGFADNVLIVGVNGSVNLDASWGYPFSGKKNGDDFGPSPSQMSPRSVPLYAGKWFEVIAGSRIQVDVILGDGGGLFEAGLFIQKQGVDYPKYPNGSPILPLFAVGPIPKDLKEAYSKNLPEEALNGPFWKTNAAPTSIMGLSR